METMLEQLFLPYVSQLGMKSTAKHLYKESGTTFLCNHEIADGFFWSYQQSDLFAVTAYDIRIQETVTPQYQHPEFFTISLFNRPVAGYIFGNGKNLPQIAGYQRPAGTFNETFAPGTHVRSTGITISPAFLQQLAERFEINYQDLIQVCFAFNTSCPDAAFIIRQIFAACPAPDYAVLYYESKVMELLAALLQRNKKSRLLPDENLSAEDIGSLDQVRCYLKHNLEREITIRDLEQVAYMGRNKLTHIFKSYYGVSIMEYLRELRIEYAKALLSDSALAIKDIASLAGYRNQGSFAEVFKRMTGVTPKEYRRALLCRHAPSIQTKHVISDESTDAYS